MHAGRVVPTEQVVDALWGEDPPPRVRNGLQALASKLRNALGAADLVVMRGGGYVLDLPADAVDIHQYEQLVAAARTAVADDDPQQAVALLRRSRVAVAGRRARRLRLRGVRAADDRPA